MKEINIARCLTEERHKKGIRQEELADYMGVSKAAVSKWESEKSYPDITLLPQLAAYFNISVDELIGYEPQMIKEDIKRLYHRLASDFSVKPFEEVMEECDTIIKKYYSCFPLLLQMSALLLNHAVLSSNSELILMKATELAGRVKSESDNLHDAKDGAALEVCGYLMMQKPEEALALQEKTIRPMTQETEMLVRTYQLLGDNDRAAQACQISIYQHLLFAICGLASYLQLHADNLPLAEKTLKRMLDMGHIFNLDHLHPNTAAQIYLSGAQVYCMHNEPDKALDLLEKYVHLCTTDFFPFTLHGDEFFDSIDSWFEDFNIGNLAPRSDRLILESLLQAVTANPYFAVLSERPRYKTLINQLTIFVG